MKFLYTNEKGGKIGHVTAYGPIAAVKIAKILKICCTVGCALIVLQQISFILKLTAQLCHSPL